MENPIKRIDLTTLLLVTIFAISLSLMNFRDFSWGTNNKSYIGFAVFLILLLIRTSTSKMK